MNAPLSIATSSRTEYRVLAYSACTDRYSQYNDHMAQPVNSVPGDEVNGLIARRAAHLRKEQNLSFDALAARSNISKGMLIAIEQGRANPSIGTLCKLAAALRLSLAELLEEVDDPRIEFRLSHLIRQTSYGMEPREGLRPC